MGHDCLVVFTTCRTGKCSKKLQDASHFNTYIRCFPTDHNKTAVHTSQEQWITYSSYVRETGYIPKLRCYTTYTTLQAAAALASLDNVRILRKENNGTLLMGTTDELIEQLLKEITKSNDRDSNRTLEATINLLQQVVLSGASLSITVLQNVRCRVRLTSMPTITDKTICKDNNIDLDVLDTLINERKGYGKYAGYNTRYHYYQ
jgi:hypothetical protein